MSDELLEKLTASETHRIKRLLIVKFLSQKNSKGYHPLIMDWLKNRSSDLVI